ncbi:hypothetical protein H7J86_26330 [Mycobacterium hackensackense]|uniref:hypothetical protein n=1 Tax=Mycobacterium hackensackense TaxID=228909 RepID=UPI0022658F46|nr:hypothetical protein [Mycobacterium hackensackense]MCV7255687.1 hypothetical protein [Mycobacterium hackensackense]
MKFPHDPAEVAVYDLGTIMNQQAEQAAAAEAGPPMIWFWTLKTQHPDRYGEGAHTTWDGAWQAMRDKAIEMAGGKLSFPAGGDANQEIALIQEVIPGVAIRLNTIPLHTP